MSLYYISDIKESFLLSLKSGMVF